MKLYLFKVSTVFAVLLCFAAFARADLEQARQQLNQAMADYYNAAKKNADPGEREGLKRKIVEPALQEYGKALDEARRRETKKAAVQAPIRQRGQKKGAAQKSKAGAQEQTAAKTPAGRGASHAVDTSSGPSRPEVTLDAAGLEREVTFPVKTKMTPAPSVPGALPAPVRK